MRQIQITIIHAASDAKEAPPMQQRNEYPSRGVQKEMESNKPAKESIRNMTVGSIEYEKPRGPIDGDVLSSGTGALLGRYST